MLCLVIKDKNVFIYKTSLHVIKASFNSSSGVTACTGPCSLIMSTMIYLATPNCVVACDLINQVGVASPP